jgi:DNA-binding NtrC family response regulator
MPQGIPLFVSIGDARQSWTPARRGIGIAAHPGERAKDAARETLVVPSPVVSNCFHGDRDVNNKETCILVVDDDADTTTMLCQLLGITVSVQHHCSTAANVVEASKLLDATFFHLVITDINMPGATGISLCRQIYENHPNTVVIIMSAMTDINYAIESMRAGAFDYLVKPIQVSQLTATIERALSYQETLMKKHYCEQSLEEEVRDLFSLNTRIRTTRSQQAERNTLRTDAAGNKG